MRPMNHAGAVPELAGASDLPGLVVTCAAAFSDDPMIRWPMPDATPAMLQELFRATGPRWRARDLVHADPALTTAGIADTRLGSR